MTYLNPSRYFPEKCTYWAQKLVASPGVSYGQDGYGGEAWENPVVLSCRWEDAEMERLSVAYRAEGETVTSNAHVYTKEKLLEGGYIYRGVSTEANPSRIVGPDGHQVAFVIRSISQVTGLKGDFVQNVALL
jgi:hypothetical protein